MKQGIFSDSPPYFKFIFSLITVLFSLILFSLLGVVLSIFIFDISVSSIDTLLIEFTTNSNINLLKFYQTVTSIGIFLIPALCLAFFFGERPLHYLSMTIQPSWKTIILSSLAIAVSLPAINFFAEFNSELIDYYFTSENWMKVKEQEALEITRTFLSIQTWNGYLFNVFMIALIPALGEEFLFRGIIQRIFTDWVKNVHIAILISAVLFSSLHIQFYGFFPRMLIGIFLGYLLFWSGSIWLPVIVHFINNCIAVTFTFLDNKGILNLDIENVGSDENTLIYALVSMALTTFLIYRVFMKEKRIL